MFESCWAHHSTHLRLAYGEPKVRSWRAIRHVESESHGVTRPQFEYNPRMSARNGQRARHHLQKKRRVVRLQKTRALAAELKEKKDAAPKK